MYWVRGNGIASPVAKIVCHGDQPAFGIELSPERTAKVRDVPSGIVVFHSIVSQDVPPPHAGSRIEVPAYPPASEVEGAPWGGGGFRDHRSKTEEVLVEAPGRIPSRKRFGGPLSPPV